MKNRLARGEWGEMYCAALTRWSNMASRGMLTVNFCQIFVGIKPSNLIAANIWIMNDTLEGGPWAPILVGSYFTGAARSRWYTVVLDRVPLPHCQTGWLYLSTGLYKQHPRCHLDEDAKLVMLSVLCLCPSLASKKSHTYACWKYPLKWLALARLR